MDKVLKFVKRHKVVVVFFIMGLTATLWWHHEYPSGTWRYKLTVTVETPEGLKTGSAVREVHVRTEPQLFPEQSPIHHSVKGEAVVIDLGQEKYLFAIMDVDGSYRIVQQAFPHSSKNFRDYIQYYKSLTGEERTLDQKDYPQFVTFKDIKDPKSVEAVKADDLATTFGASVKLKGITIEITDERVTRGVVGKFMPSYSPQQEYLKWLRTLPYGDPRAINADNFGSVGDR